MWRVPKPESVPADAWLSDTCVPKVRIDAMHSMHSPISPDLLYGYRDQQLFHQSHSGCMSTVQTPWLHTTNPSPSVSWVLWPVCESPWTRSIHEQSLVHEEKRQNLQDSVYQLQKERSRPRENTTAASPTAHEDQQTPALRLHHKKTIPKPYLHVRSCPMHITFAGDIVYPGCDVMTAEDFTWLRIRDKRYR